ncbi:MAG: PAS domain S-box protein [Beijerinckiaceae bacterium]
MVEVSNAPELDETEIAPLFADAAFGELLRASAPALVASIESGTVIWANQAAGCLLGEALGAIPSRLSSVAQPVTGDAPRLKRLLTETGRGLMLLTFLCKRASLPHGRSVLVAAVLGRPAASAPAGLQAATPDGSENTAAGQAAGEAPPAPATPPSLGPAPAPAADQIRQALIRRHPSALVRFLWQSDADDRVTSVTPPLAEIVGAAHADLVGRDLAEIVDTLRLDRTGRLMSAMRARETWSRIEVVWPIAGAAASVPIDLGAFPAFGGDRGFRGFRGFGVIHLDRISDAEPLEPRLQGGAVGGEPEPEPGDDTAGATIPSGSDPGSRSQAPIEAEDIPPATAANVVPLRPYAALAGVLGSRQPQEQTSAPSEQPEEEAQSRDLAAQQLSASEHHAFDEIARALSNGDDMHPASDYWGAPDIEAASGETPGSTARAEHRDDAVAILDRLPVGILVSRGETPVYANRMLLDLTGYSSASELRAAGGLSRLFKGPAPENAAPVARTHPIQTREGETMAAEARVQAIAWEGEPASLLTLRRASDGAHFAHAKTLEAELQQREAETRELHAILDTATDGVAIIDADGRLMSLNRSGEALFGYDQNEVAGEPFTMLIAAESRPLVDDYLSRLKSGGVARLLHGREVFGIARQGGTIPVFLTLGRVNSEEAHPKFCAVLRDMTSWKQAEQEAREAREEAERASAVKTDFLAKVSHEIRTPLNAIIGFAEVIMDERLGPIGSERYKDYLRDIYKSGTHVMSLVNDLLDLSKIEAGKMVLDIQRVDANSVIAECVALMQPQANRERVIMRLALAPRLANISADERSLRQIVLNLLSNAVKYNEPGGQVIVSSAMTDTGHAVIRIKDTGIGMSDAELAVALEPFRQVATARSITGTGLGLPLTKALVEANRAAFTIRSRKNEGTLVEVTFPPARVLAESA